MAKRLADPAALLEAHDAFAQVVSGKVAPARYLELARGAIQVADAMPPEMLGEDIVLLGRVTNRLAAAGRLMADPEVFAEGFARAERLAEVTGVPHTRAMVLRLQAGEALARGRLDAAVDFADEMVATCGHDLNFLNTAWEVKLMTALVAGRLDDVCRACTRRSATRVLETRELAATLAVALAGSGAHAEASAIIAAVIEAGIPWSWARPRALWAAAETAARLDDRELAATLRPLLDVHRGSLLSPTRRAARSTAPPTPRSANSKRCSADSTQRIRDLRPDSRLEERMGYDAPAARTRVWWAWMLTSRGRAEDIDAAANLRMGAERAVRRLGLGLLERDLRDTAGGIDHRRR